MTQEFIRAVQKIISQNSQGIGFEKALRNVKVLGGGGGNLQVALKVEEEHQNHNGMLHGGMTALLVDGISTFALMHHPLAKNNRGVSVDMKISYMSAVKVGDEILINASTDKVGKLLAFLTVDILNRSNGKLVAKGTHSKFIGGSAAFGKKE